MIRQLVEIQVEQNDILRRLAAADHDYLRGSFEENQEKLRRLFAEVMLAPSAT
ncbi:hypothetical protein HYW67_01955 [Candidatus Parcubacteria bacterium]|nr:hypothetical protein [Candidatus Parcubacteria bacterium]